MKTKTFTGRCGECGRLLEVEDLELTMTLREGKYRYKSERFNTLLCTGRCVVRRERNCHRAGAAVPPVLALNAGCAWSCGRRLPQEYCAAHRLDGCAWTLGL